MTADDAQEEQAIEVVLSVDDAQLEELPALVDRVEAAGMEAISVQESIGTLTGRVRPSALPELRSLPGVDSVERSRSFQLPPPDSTLQGGPADEEL